MELWIEDVQGFDEMSASYNDLLSVQERREIEQWLVLVDVHSNVDSMAAASSSLELVNFLPLVLMVVTWFGDPLIMTAAPPPFFVPLLVDPSLYMV